MRWLPIAAACGLLLVTGVLVSGVLPTGSDSDDARGAGAGGSVDTAEQTTARAFLDRYVEDGRVVREDQGGDTVSEGQAYGMLVALALGDEETFSQIWDWTRQHLMRPDGLLSWRWTQEGIADPSSASDADLDAARALVTAAQVFDDPAYADAGARLGEAVLEHETVLTPRGRVLVAGQWATTAPYRFNPSYVSPVATTILAEATGDPRWSELEEGSRDAVDQVTPDGQLPPDWAEVGEDGSVRPVPGPAGEPVRFGYDAARTLVRHAESCDRVDREYAAQAADLLGDDRPAVAVYDLAGSPQTGDPSPLAGVAQGAALAAAGERDRAARALEAGVAASTEQPTYYGDAWAGLGRILLETDALGGCPVLEGAS